MSYKIYSFDIFDTLLSRLSTKPEAVFFLLQKELDNSYPADFRKNFAYIRSYCGILARTRNGTDVPFAKIYALMQELFDLSELQVSYLMKREIWYERKLLRGITKNIQYVESLIRQNKKVILITDMYHSTAVLRSFIKPYSKLISDNCEIFCSAEVGATKLQGDLFLKILQHFSLEPKDLKHFGDNLYADYLVPKKMGIEAIRYEPEGVKSFAKEVNDQNCNVGGVFVCKALSSLIVSKKDGYYNVGVCLAGPILLSYVIWVLKTAKKLGRKKLYFLSRDGYILKKIAEQIKCDFYPEIELFYLHVSRHAVMGALLDLDKNSTWDHIFLNYPEVTVREVASRLSLTIDELMNTLSQKGRKYAAEDKLDFDNCSWVRWAITNSTLKRVIQQRVSDNKDNLKKYLKKNEFTYENAALVDVGWKGTIQDCLFKVVQEQDSKCQLQGLYFGLSDYTKSYSKRNTKRGYAFSPFTKTVFSKNILFFIEVFTHANQNTTISYGVDGVPVFAKEELLNFTHVNELQQGILDFCNYVKQENLLNEAYLADEFSAYLITLLNPSKALADVLGDYSHSVGTTDNLHEFLAPQEGIVGLYKRWKTGRRPVWMAGYKQRLTPLAKFLLNIYKLTQEFKRKK